MSRHQAYRNYDYENDLDEYEGEDFDEEDDGMSPEDRVQMTAGTAQVREALADHASKVTTGQIQEALWHYYFDVDKSLAYLIKKFVDPPASKTPKTPPAEVSKTPGKLVMNSFDAAASTALPHSHFSVAGFFHDMPWMNIPRDRQAEFIEPLRPRCGLLGGSSTPAPKPMSKLQALAAARKKKAEEEKAAKDSDGVLQSTDQLSTNPPASFELPAPASSSGSLPSRKENQPPSKPTSGDKTNSLAALTKKRLKIGSSESAATESVPDDSEAPMSHTNPEVVMAQELHQEEEAPVEAAEPSAFAQTLFGLSDPGSAPTPVPRPATYKYPYPYLNPSSPVTDPFSEPSPDDVVLAAQSKASNKKLAQATAQQKDGSKTSAKGASEGMNNLKIDDTPLPKSKNLDVIREFKKSKAKKSASFVVVGHVDAGKSTLMGRLLLDMDFVDKRTIDKYKKEAEMMGKSSFALAWVLDQRTEERSRGVTIDIATNKFETDTTSFTILDAPGHRDFIPNMIAGASQADFAVLVVDASTGAFEAGLKGQTREHSLLIRSMGVSRIIVAVNKLDTVGWSQERFDEISQQVTGFLTATNFQSKNISFVPVSGLLGDNLVKKTTDAAASWYKGGTLVEELEKSEPLARALDKPMRMTISEVYRTPQSPITISGRLESGTLQMGDALIIQPSGEKAYVKSLELDGEPVDWTVAGQNAVIHLTSHIEAQHVRMGDIACEAKNPVPCVNSFTIKALAFDVLMPMQVDIHRGRLHAPGQIVEMPALLDRVQGTVTKKRPHIVKPNNVARLVVRLGREAKIPVEAGQRIVLRSGGETIAAGLLE